MPPLSERIIFSIVMSCFLAFFMSAMVTFINVGAVPHYFASWMKAYSVAWPIAAVVSFFAVPVGRKITAKIMRMTGMN